MKFSVVYVEILKLRRIALFGSTFPGVFGRNIIHQDSWNLSRFSWYIFIPAWITLIDLLSMNSSSGKQTIMSVFQRYITLSSSNLSSKNILFVVRRLFIHLLLFLFLLIFHTLFTVSFDLTQFITISSKHFWRMKNLYAYNTFPKTILMKIQLP